MNNKSIIAVSGIALLMATTSMAFADNSQAENTGNTSVVEDVKSGLAKADQKIRDAADEVKAFFIGDEKRELIVSLSSTAGGMIGETIESPSGDSIAKVEDIIIDRSGTAHKIIVSDGGVLGIGDKLAAFDYGRVITQKDDGNVVMQVSQDLIDGAKDFSYDASQETQRVAAKGAGNFSVDEIMDGNVLDPSGKKVADIENVSFRAGKAESVIIGFDKTMGMGGSIAAIDFGNVALQQSKGTVDIKLTQTQADQFTRFKTSLRG